MNNIDQIQNTIVETEKYIDELEDQLCNYEDVIAERDYLKSELTKGQTKLDYIKIEKTNILNELIRETKELSCKYNIQEEKLIGLQEENNCLQCENEEILNKLDELQINIHKLDNINSTLLENKKILERQLSESMEITNKLKDRKQLTQLKLQDTEQEIICTQNTIAEKITQITELEKNINIEQDRYECLQSTICELKMKSENISKTLKAKKAEIRCKVNEKSAELCVLKFKLKDKQAEELEQKNRTIQLKKELNLFKQEHCKEKCRVDKKIGELRVELKSIASNLKLINSKLCDAQIESTNLKCQIKNQNESIKQLDSTKEMLQQEVKRIKETTDSTTEMITAQLKKHDNDKKMFDRKLDLKLKEHCELKKLSKNQTEQLTKLKKKILDVKCNLVGKCTPDMCT